MNKLAGGGRMSNELKPCPFCGGEAQLVEEDRGDYIACTECDAEFGHVKLYGNPLYLIRQWNKRTLRFAYGDGEMEQPEATGWFWFRGYVGGYLEGIGRQGLVQVAEGGIVWPTWGSGYDELSEYIGAWWGPIVPPWEAS